MNPFMPQTILLPLTLEIGLVIAWSSGFIGGSLASMTASIFGVLFWRFLLATLILAPFTIRAIRRTSFAEIGLQALIGSFAMFGYLSMMISAISLGVPAGIAALIAALQPLATAACVGLVLREKVILKQWIGLALGFIGVAIPVLGSIDDASFAGYLLAFGSMISIVIATLISKKKATNSPVLPSLTIQCFMSTVLFMPLAIIDNALMPELNRPFIYAVIWFVVFSTFAAYGLYWVNLARTSATRVSSLIYLTPPVTSVWAYMMFDEPITKAIIIGFSLSIFGVLLAKSKTTLNKSTIPHCKQTLDGNYQCRSINTNRDH